MASTILTREFKRIPLDEIRPNPNQPRKIFDETALSELSNSIKRYGIITPLTVRNASFGYELVAGERRLRAAKNADIKQVPCYIVEASEKDSSLMAIVENLQRKDLDFFEEALSLRCLIEKYGLTQQQTAEKIGKTQSAVANKLRLLRLSPEVTKLIRERGLSERHARTLLRLSEERQLFAAEVMSMENMSVQQAEEYVDKLILEDTTTPQNDEKTQKHSKKPIFYIKDVRIFNNSLMRSVELMRSSGLDVKVKREQNEDVVTYTITIPEGIKKEQIKTSTPIVSRETMEQNDKMPNAQGECFT